MASKITFTLDKDTTTRLDEDSEDFGQPKSEIVREAILQYHERHGELSYEERTKMLWAIDNLLPKIKPRRRSEIDRELAEIRAARRSGGRRHPVS